MALDASDAVTDHVDSAVRVADATVRAVERRSARSGRPGRRLTDSLVYVLLVADDGWRARSRVDRLVDVLVLLVLGQRPVPYGALVPLALPLGRVEVRVVASNRPPSRGLVDNTHARVAAPDRHART